MKKVLSLFLSVLMLTSIAAAVDFSAYANVNHNSGSYISGNYEYNVKSDGTASIAFYFGSAEKVTIPSKLGGYKVTNIDQCAFELCTGLTSVTIPSSVTSIDEFAFSECTNLKSVSLSSNLESIGSGAFENCESLTSITIPDSVTEIGDTAFSYCTSLKSIAIPDGIKTIGTTFFMGCQSLKYIFIPESVKSIGVEAFSECVSLKDVYYGGSQSKWKKVSIDNEFNENYYLNNAAFHYNHSHSYSVSSKGSVSDKKSGKMKCSVCGLTKRLYYPKTMSLSTTSYTYNAKAKKPTVTIKDSNGSKISSKYYTVSYISQSTGKKVSSMKNPGKYYVKVTFKTRYSGSLKKAVTIKPKKTSIKSIKASSKGFTVKWDKQATQTTGYQVQYSTSKSFKSAKTKTISKTGTTSKKVTGLKAKKKYYVRVRTYKTVKVNGKNTKIYSSWSSVKGVTTKK